MNWFEDDKPAKEPKKVEYAIDPMLNYLLEKNKFNSIEYKGRHVIRPGGLQKMLDNYKEFGLKHTIEHIEQPADFKGGKDA